MYRGYLHGRACGEFTPPCSHFPFSDLSLCVRRPAFLDVGNLCVPTGICVLTQAIGRHARRGWIFLPPSISTP